jgi:hypothetical protein
LLNVMVHELGHDYSLGDCTACSNTAMAYPISGSSPIFPTGCDERNIYSDTAGTEGANISCTSTPPSCSGGAAATCSSTGVWSCPSTACASGYCNGVCLDNVCPGGGGVCQNGQPNCPNGGSPIIVDWDGSGIHLTGPNGAKLWTFFPDRPAVKIDWIDVTSTNAFLVLDRNGNGVIDNASEMFGNLTE